MSPTAPIPPVRDIVRIPLDWSLSPERAALLVRDDVQPLALIGRWAGGGAIVGSEPLIVAAEDDDPFELLDQQPEIASTVTPAEPGTVGGGWFGWLGYELGRRVEPVGAGPPANAGAVPFAFAFYDHLLRLDTHGQWWFEALRTEGRDAMLRARLDTFRARAAAAPEPQPFSTDDWRATPFPAGHASAVAACRTRIVAGDLFQANIGVRLHSRLTGAPIDLFAAAASELRPDRAAFMAGPRGAIASLSPELFLERRGRRVRSAPIKGTRPRPADARLAQAQREDLEASEKDRAENVMIVDLVRNDLGRVCVFGSVSAESLCQARAHAGVWHLVSEVAGTLRDEVGDRELVRAAFPPGSVTGAPKVAAMNVIAELESTARRLYTGAIGFASPIAGLDLSVAIRTIEFAGDDAWLGVGGGIVADSDPAAEAAECMTKAAPLLTAIGARLSGAPCSSGVAPPAPRRLHPKPLPRPEPAAGVFETLLVAAGRPMALERHMARLSRSVAALYGRPLPPGLAEELLEVAASADRARMRVDFRPSSGIGLELTPVGERRVPLNLIPTTVPGGLGDHKWIDRRLVDALSRDGQPLLCDLDGYVLETARGNVFAVDDTGRLLTPPADGRILPGVTRARVLELARGLGLTVTAQPVELRSLSEMRELFVTGALGGVEPAQIDGPPSHPGALTTRLAEALHDRELAPAGSI